MALITPPQIIGLARVNVVSAEGVPTSLTYDFADGFDSDRIDGAPNAPVIASLGQGKYALFLDNPEAPGSASTQGGLKARVDAVAVATATNTATIGADLLAISLIEMRWYYGDYVLPAPYTAVDPQKAIVVGAFLNGSPYLNSLKFDIAVFRDPVTKFVPKGLGIFGS